MNPTEEQRLLNTLSRIAHHTHAITLWLANETDTWQERYGCIQDALGMIANGVAPPAHNAGHRPKPDEHRTATRIDNLETALYQLVIHVHAIQNQLSNKPGKD